jgi:hypothetical protein
MVETTLNRYAYPRARYVPIPVHRCIMLSAPVLFRDKLLEVGYVCRCVDSPNFISPHNFVNFSIRFIKLGSVSRKVFKGML